MLVISLTSIPPRYGQLPRVLAGLLAQGADRVVLVIPHHPHRFRPAPLPALPAGAVVLETQGDLGPAGKLLTAALAYPDADILYCDDDWLYEPGWANAFTVERKPLGSATVTAGSSWPSERIGRQGGTIVQGYAGVCVAAKHALRIPPPPAEAWAVDDIWLSGWFAGLGLTVTGAPGARALCTPLASPGALQDGIDRNMANRATAGLIHDRFGIWPVV